MTQNTARETTGKSVRISNVTKYFGDFCAVGDLSLDVEAGEFVSLLGSSGSGKTSLLMMVAGFEKPNSGRIEIGNRDITALAANKRGLGMVFQKYALFPHMSIAENIGYPLKMRNIGASERQKRVRSALDMVQLGHLEDRLPSQLSGGQQQRVAVARALVFEPPVLLMDEPLGALDKKLREEMQFEITTIQKRLGVTVIYVTHDQEEALTMSDRIAVMSHGRIEQIGSPSDLYQAPKSPFVAEFIGRMNFVTGECAGVDGNRIGVRVFGDSIISVPHPASRPVTPGETVSVALRPENLRLAAQGTGADNVLRARVDAVVFAGAHHTFVLSLLGREDLQIQVQSPISEWADVSRGDVVDVVLGNNGISTFLASEVS